MIRLTAHVQRRVQERHLALDWIEAAITTPDWTAADPDPMLTRSYKVVASFGGRVLKVVHRADGPDVVVVTAYFDRGARRP